MDPFFFFFNAARLMGEGDEHDVRPVAVLAEDVPIATAEVPFAEQTALTMVALLSMATRPATRYVEEGMIDVVGLLCGG